MFNPQAYENSRSDGFGVLEVTSNQPTRQFVPLKRSELKGEIIGPLASLRLIQTFGYSRDQSDQVLEAIYRFPMPGDAAVTAVRIRFGTVEIRADLKPRQQAEADYEEARQQGQQAALLTPESPNVFTLHITGLQPDQEIIVETAYVQLARAEGAGWTLRLPLTTSPRYVRADEGASRHAQGQPLCLLRDPGHRFALDLTLRGAAGITSPTHRLASQRDGDRLRIRLEEGEMIPDRDCVLSWQPVQEKNRAVLQVFLHDDRPSGQVYFLALAAPLATHDRGRGVPREVILLVDHSGSMMGPKWQAADWAVEKFIAELTERDALQVGLFHNTTRWYVKKPTLASKSVKDNAIDFLKKHRDNGGTELGVALEQALHLHRTEGELPRHVLIITDAEVTDFGRVLKLADQEAKRPDRRRISVLCIDAAPNALLATELAERGGGVARFLTSQPDQEDIATALDNVLADWSEPVLTGLRLEVNRPQVEAAAREVLAGSDPGWSAIDLGDLPAGRAVWVAGRVPRGEATELAFQLTTAKQWRGSSCQLDLNREADARPALKALFGARRLQGLEWALHGGSLDSLRHLGYDPEQVAQAPAGTPAKVYAENAQADRTAALRALLAQESLAYGLACSETAFIAVRAEPGQPVSETIAVANALPAGWSEGFVNLYAAAPPSTPGLTAAGGLVGMARAVKRSLMRSKSLDYSMATLMPVAAAAESPPARQEKAVVLFTGAPTFAAGEAILFDSARSADAAKLPAQATFDRLEVRCPGGKLDPDTLYSGLSLLLFVDDLAAPRARVCLADIVRQAGKRPLNLRKLPGQVVRLVLVDPAGAWAQAPPNLEVALRWSAG
jgi:Ca-activated chloride channel family protein